MNGSQSQRQYDMVLRSVEPQLVASQRKIAADDNEIQPIFEEYELAGIPLVACVVHPGGYVTVYQAYNALFAWIEANAYRISGPVAKCTCATAQTGSNSNYRPRIWRKGPFLS